MDKTISIKTLLVKSSGKNLAEGKKEYNSILVGYKYITNAHPIIIPLQPGVGIGNIGWGYTIQIRPANLKNVRLALVDRNPIHQYANPTFSDPTFHPSLP